MNDKLIGILILIFMVGVLIFQIISLKEFNSKQDEYDMIITFITFIIVIIVSTIILLVIKPKYLIIYNEKSKVLEIRAGQSVFKQLKVIEVSINDVLSVKYNKPESHHFIILSTHRVGHVRIKLKNGGILDVCSLENPQNVVNKLYELVDTDAEKNKIEGIHDGKTVISSL